MNATAQAARSSGATTIRTQEASETRSKTPKKPKITTASKEQLIEHYHSQLDAYNKKVQEMLDEAAEAEGMRLSIRGPMTRIEDPDAVTKEQLVELIRRQNHRLGRTVKRRSMDLLQYIDGKNEVHRTVGLPYDEILRILSIEFPEASTSAACLRWYVVNAWTTADELGVARPKMPQIRPRSKPAGKRAEAM